MNELQIQRLEDFKKILTYLIVSKIHYYLKDNYKLYYLAPAQWKKWRAKDRKIKYSKQIYQLIVIFNQVALSTKQIKHIFGKDKDGKYLNYSEAIASVSTIKTFNKGTIAMSGRRFNLKKRHVFDISVIEPIFKDKDLLAKVLDATSDYYSKRQTRLIFSQINVKAEKHYKTAKEIEETKKAEEEANEIAEEMIKSGISDIEGMSEEDLVNNIEL